jgi:dipeptidyl aminopeptidase/acylaminoacyl peptidase
LRDTQRAVLDTNLDNRRCIHPLGGLVGGWQGSMILGRELQAPLTRLAATAFMSLWLAGQAAPVYAQQHRLSIEQIDSAPFPYDMVAAPSGGAVAWVYNERGARNIWVAEPTGGAYAARRVTSYVGDEGIDIGGPHWTGDGKWIVYNRGGDNGGRVAVNPTSAPAGPKAGAVWAVPVAGGAPKRLGEGLSPSPSPTGDTVVFVRGGQVMVVAANGGEPTVLFIDRGQVGAMHWSPDGARLAFVSSRANHSMVGVYDLAAKTITWMAPSIDSDDYPTWSPDGRRIAFVRSPSGENQLQGLNREGTPWSLWVADASTGQGQRIWVSKPGAGSRFRHLFNSDDSLFWGQGDHLVFPWESTGWVRLYSVPASGGDATLLTPGNSEVFGGQISPDRSKVIFTTNQGDIDRRHIWAVGVNGGPATQLTTSRGIEDFPVVTADNRIFALRGEAKVPLRPVAIVNKAMVDLAPQAIPADFPSAQLVEPQLVTFEAADGQIVHGQLFVPLNLKGKAPALLFTHGGPTNRQTFAAWDSFETHTHLYEANQFLAANGYVVLSINYRGGSGYGLDWREAKGFGATGASELNDIIGAAKFLQQRPEVDSQRMGVWGGSYGGRMTSLALARTPEFWVAGVDYAGVHDMTETPGYNPTDPVARKLAYDSSAIAHVDTWKAPVLLAVGDADALEPQTMELAAALRARGVPVEQLLLPDEVHFMLLHRSWNTVFQHTKDYFDRFLKP